MIDEDLGPLVVIGQGVVGEAVFDPAPEDPVMIGLAALVDGEASHHALCPVDRIIRRAGNGPDTVDGQRRGADHAHADHDHVDHGREEERKRRKIEDTTSLDDHLLREVPPQVRRNQKQHALIRNEEIIRMFVKN